MRTEKSGRKIPGTIGIIGSDPTYALKEAVSSDFYYWDELQLISYITDYTCCMVDAMSSQQFEEFISDRDIQALLVTNTFKFVSVSVVNEFEQYELRKRMSKLCPIFWQNSTDPEKWDFYPVY